MRIYVGGIPFSTDNSALRSLFETIGAVSDANVVTDRYTSQSRGFGFVDMPDSSEAKAAIAKFEGYSLEGRSLTVNEAKPREERSAGSGSGNSNATRSGRW